jgi:hypothetical protein
VRTPLKSKAIDSGLNAVFQVSLSKDIFQVTFHSGRADTQSGSHLFICLSERYQIQNSLLCRREFRFDTAHCFESFCSVERLLSRETGIRNVEVFLPAECLNTVVRVRRNLAIAQQIVLDSEFT